MTDYRLTRIEQRLGPSDEPHQPEPAPDEGPLAHLTDQELREAEAALMRKLADEFHAGRATLDDASPRFDRQIRREQALRAGDLGVRCPLCFAGDHLEGSRPHQWRIADDLVGDDGVRYESPAWPYSPDERRRASEQL